MTVRDLSPSPQNAIAIHEAAHGIIASLYGLPLVKVTLKPALCTYDWTRIQKSDSVEQGYLLSTLAAQQAELTILGHDQPEASANDVALVHGVFAKRGIDADHADRVIAKLRPQTRELVERHRNAIVRAARVLKAFNFMTGDDVCRIVGKDAAPRPRPEPRARVAPRSGSSTLFDLPATR